MVDVVRCNGLARTGANEQVANHLGAGHLQNWAPSSEFGPFDSASDFHPYCEPNWSTEPQLELEQCESIIRRGSKRTDFRLVIRPYA